MEDGSLIITSCLGTQTFPETAVSMILYQQSDFLHDIRNLGAIFLNSYAQSRHWNDVHVPQAYNLHEDK